MNSSNSNLSPLAESDLELLSAYLDNQLSVAERVGLERRIAAEPRLRAELEELRATTAALGALEPLRPPRSFTLDPATAPRRRTLASPFAWVMQLGSGLAGLALVLLATVQMLGGGPLPAPLPASAPAAMATEAAVTIMEAPQAYEAAEPTEAPAAMAAPTAAAAAEMRQPEATPAPASEPMAAQDAAPTMAGAEATPKEPGAAEAGDSAADAAGGVGGGPASNSPAGAPPPAADQMVAPSAQANDTASAGTIEPALEPAAAAAPMAAAPWLTLALGAALIGLAIGLNLAGRRG